jgi:extracellular elastinolytic metalloproteinase
MNNATYEVYAIPEENPDTGSRTIETDPYILNPTPATVPSPFGWHDTNGSPGAEQTITSGNNVNAYADRDADDGPDAGSQPNGGANLDFTGALVPIDPTQAPSTYTAAAVVNLFYWSNILHDVHYLYGFDEAARNFQVNNYGRGGTGGDAVNAEAQDGSGTNNANFATPPDGTPPRMQMFEFTVTTPNRDGDFDNGIIIHEYGHGVSNRLTGNGLGLFALQSGGMGEGWSDFWSLLLTQESADETTAGRGVGTYVLGQPTTGDGVRAFKYDFDITNPNLETFLN